MSPFSIDSVTSASPGSAPPSAASSGPLDDLKDQNKSEHAHLNGSAAVSGSNDVHLNSAAHADNDPYSHPGPDHVIRLSSIEHCMPRSYIRICLAYRLPHEEMLREIEEKLNSYIRRIVDAKPYLSGYVVAVDQPGNRIGAVEIRFSDTDFLEYPKVNVRRLTWEEVPFTYDQLNEMGLPPSVIKPDLVSALKESADEDWAPVFRIQANVIEGGLIISVYLHHCISDGTGIGLLISGSLLHDDFTFDRHLDSGCHGAPSLSMRLEAFANHKSVVREELSYSSGNQINTRQLKCKTVQATTPVNNDRPKVRGRGCVLAFPVAKLVDFRDRLMAHARGEFMTRNVVLQTLVWHGMTKARIPSLCQDPPVTASKLLIPINIRKKLKKPLSESYFGAAIDFASVQMPLTHFQNTSMSSFAETALAIREAIHSVDEAYIRQAIALAKYPNPNLDVRDLQASNMDRANGADMYITSWEKLQCYDATFEMGLGRPDWVRKPWSKDPGSCIVLPFDKRKDHLEVVVQMTEGDMERLLKDSEFMEYVSRRID